MTKPRVLLSGHLPPPMGGIGTYCETLLGSRLGENVDLRFVQSSSQQRALRASGKASWGNLVQAARDCGRFLRACFLLRPDIAHICTAPGLSFLKNSLFVVMARLIGCRVLLHPHCGLAALCGTGRPWRWICALVFRGSNGILGLSREWLALRETVAEDKIHYLPNAIDIGPYVKLASRRSRADGRPIRLLYLGYLGEAKGTYDLLEAFRIMDVGGSEAVLDLVGDFLTDQDGECLKRMAARPPGPGKAWSLRPPASGAAKLACFERADVFVFPSHREGMPMAILEAMASGLPVVATSVGGIPDLIVDGANGFLAVPHAPPALALSMAKLCRDAELRSEIGTRNTIASRDHDVSGHAQKLLAIYDRLLASRR